MQNLSFLLVFLAQNTFALTAEQEISPAQIEKLKSEIRERVHSHDTPSDVGPDLPGNTTRNDTNPLPPIVEDRNWSYDFNSKQIEDNYLVFPKHFPRFDPPNEESIFLTRLPYRQEVTLSAGTLTTGSLLGAYSNEKPDIKPYVAVQFALGRGFQNDFQKNHGSYQDTGADMSFTRHLSTHDQVRLGFAYLDNASNEPFLHTSGQMASSSRGFFQADSAPLGGRTTSYSVWTRYEVLLNSDQKFELLPFASHSKKLLYHDETLFRVDPVKGDERERLEEGNRFGVRAIYRRVDRDHSIAMASIIDGSIAIDSQNFQLYSTQNRNRLQLLLNSDENRTNAGLALKQEIAWTDWLISKANVDVQWMQLDFSPRFAPSQFIKGSRDEIVLNPLAELDVKLGKRSTFSMKTGVNHTVNEFGSLFNNTRNTSFSNKTTLYELAFETRAISRRLSSSASVFIAIDDPRSFLDDSDLGVVQIPSQKRVGFEMTSRYQIYRPIYFTCGFSLSRTKAAPKQSPFDSFTFEPNRRLKIGIDVEPTLGFYGGVGVSHLSQQLALDDSGLSVPGWWRLDAQLGYRTKGLDLQLAFLNLAGAEIWVNPIARVTNAQKPSATNCGPGAVPISSNGQFLGCEQVLFAPAPPFAVTASARASF